MGTFGIRILQRIWRLESLLCSMGARSTDTMSTSLETGGLPGIDWVVRHTSGVISGIFLLANQVRECFFELLILKWEVVDYSIEGDWDLRNLLYSLRFNITAATLIPGSNYREQ